MTKPNTDDWKTPLGVYEKAIAELRRTREQIQTEIQTFRQMPIPINEFSELKAELKKSHLKIEALTADLEQTKTELVNTQKIASAAQEQVANAEKQADYAQKELEKLTKVMNNNQSSNTELIEMVKKLQEQLEQLSSIPKTENLPDRIMVDISDLRSQVSKLSDELMLVSPVTGTDYSSLRDLLANKEWKKADEETREIMLKISKRDENGWLDRGNIEQFPWQDFRIINRLWLEYSNSKFGFSVQKQIWENIEVASNNDFEVEKTLGDRVGWRNNNVWLKYEELTFDLSAFEGHLPSTLHLLGIEHGKVEGRIRLLFSTDKSGAVRRRKKKQ